MPLIPFLARSVFAVPVALGLALCFARGDGADAQSFDKARPRFDVKLGAAHKETPQPVPTAPPRAGGFWQRFERGFAFWSAKTGARAVTPSVYAAWMKDGREKGYLGFPVSDEKACTAPDAKDRFQVFEGGRIHWDDSEKRAFVYPNPTRVGDGGFCERRSKIPTRVDAKDLARLKEVPISPAQRDVLRAAGCAAPQSWLIGDVQERYLGHFSARLSTLTPAPASTFADRVWAKVETDLRYTLIKDKITPGSADATCLRKLVLASAATAVGRFGKAGGVENWDFERGLEGWTAEGDAFSGQPTIGDNVTAQRVRKVPIGGDYWYGPYPIGHQGDRWIGTFERRPDERTPLGTTRGESATGALTSKAFPLTSRWMTFLVGGGFDAERLRVSLLVRAEPGASTPALAQSGGAAPRRVRLDDGEYVAVISASGHGGEELRREVWDVGALRGKTCRVQIEDRSPAGHINVDDFRFVDEDPSKTLVEIASAPPGSRSARHYIDADRPVWGFADLHVHPAAHQSMGGLSGDVRTLWGVPGGRWELYKRNPELIFEDIPRCNGYNHRDVTPMQVGWEGFLPAGLLGVLSGRPLEMSIAGMLQLFLHEKGDPGFKRTDAFKDGAHQQHHITAIRRAYEGGLRLMSALAVHSEFMELIANKVKRTPGGQPYVQLTAEMDLVKAGACFTRQLAALNSEWMEIAYSPEDARRIIAQNKLAIVLGMELPWAGALGVGGPEAEVEALYQLGIRQVTFIHGANNHNGGTAIFQDVYDWFNDLMWSDRTLDRVSRTHREVTARPGTFIEHDEGGCHAADSPLRGQRGECVLYKLGKLGLRPVVTTISEIGRDYFPIVLGAAAFMPVVASPLMLVPGLGILVQAAVTLIAPLLPALYAALMASAPANTPSGLVSPPADLLAKMAFKKANALVRNLNEMTDGRGHLNKVGLTEKGKKYVKALMDHGMLPDIAHLSDKSVRDLFQISMDRSVKALGAKCRLGTTAAEIRAKLARIPQECFDGASPVVYSHAAFRALAIQRMTDKNDGRGRATTSKDSAPSEFKPSETTVEVLRRLGGIAGISMNLGHAIVDPPSWQRPIAVKNDCASSTKGFAWGFAYGVQKLGRKGVAIGTDAGYHDMTGPRFGRQACSGQLGAADVERALNPDFYDAAAQRNGVRYAGMTQRYHTRAHPPMTPYRAANIVYDYNLDGWANYGVVPDFIQDMRNVGMTETDLAPMFRSASDYVDTWAKAKRVSGCGKPGGQCAGWRGPAAIDCGRACNGTCPNDARRGAPKPAREYRVEGILTNDTIQDSTDAFCAAKQLRVSNADSPRQQCGLAMRWCGFDRACLHRINVCAGILGAKAWSRCEDDPDRPLSDIMNGPEIRLGACYAQKDLHCDDVSVPGNVDATARGRKTCDELKRTKAVRCPAGSLAPSARWTDLGRKECRGPMRLYTAKITNFGRVDPALACDQTPTTVPTPAGAVPFPRPTRCVDSILNGWWGEFEVQDESCRASFRPPFWSRLDDRDCRGTQRMYSGQILNMGTLRPEDACYGTPTTIAGQRFNGAKRCIWWPHGTFGEFDVNDARCAASRQPYWETPEDQGCKNGKRLYSAKILETGQLPSGDACLRTSISLGGRVIARPDLCDNVPIVGPLGGSWGKWSLEDPRCGGDKNPPYWGKLADRGCRGPVRMHSGELLNMGALPWDVACRTTTASIGNRNQTATRCVQWPHGMYGEFDVEDSGCRAQQRPPRWDRFEDKGCVGAIRRFSSRILDPGTWRDEDACARTPADVGGRRGVSITRCVNGLLGGVWGEWDLADERCRAQSAASPPYWDAFERKECRGPKRLYSAKIRNPGAMRTEDACARTPARVAGVSFATPTRCVTWNLIGPLGGTWGEFEIADAACNAGFQPPHWDKFEDKGCVGRKRLWAAKIRDVGSLRHEDACRQTPATFGAQRFNGPAYCDSPVWGSWGHFLADDPLCR